MLEIQAQIKSDAGIGQPIEQTRVFVEIEKQCF